MKKNLNWTTLYLIVCFIAITVIAIMFSSLLTWMIWASTVFGIISSKFTSDGKWLAFVFDIISYLIYIYVCLKQNYIGELILSVIVIVIYMFGLFEWKNNQQKQRVTIRNLSKKETIISLCASLVITAVYALILILLKSDLPILNAFSTIFYMLGNYYCYRRSIYQFYGWIGYEITFIALWIISACTGSISSIIFLVGGISEFIYNIIGIVSWNKTKRVQSDTTTNIENKNDTN